MKKRILALVCTLALLLGMFSVGATANTDSASQYQVGYSKKDVNPWVKSDHISFGIEPAQADGTAYTDGRIVTMQINNPADPTQTVDQPIVAVRLAGYGSAYNSFADAICDDNGDGLVLPGQDGLAFTVTSVTDDRGKTVMYCTMDSIGAYSPFVNAVRAGIVEALPGVIEANDIMITASHSHSAPDLDDCRTAADGTARKAYYDYYVAQAIAAATEAYNDRTAATAMSKGTIDAADSMKAQGYTYRDGTGFQMNFVRHYNATATDKYTLLGNTVSESDPYPIVRGDNFGYDKTDSEGIGTHVYSSTYVDHVSQANDSMNILQFTREGANPIVLVEWRAHASVIGNSTSTVLSSDFINALRYRLENNSGISGDPDATDYCVGYWQGAAGNINVSSHLTSEYTFVPGNISTGAGYPTIDGSKIGVKVPRDDTGKADSAANVKYKNALYGYLLGQIALDCLDSEMQTVSMGPIHSVTSNMSADRQTYSDGLKACVTQWNKEYPNDDDKLAASYPYHYEYKGETYGLNSYYHGVYTLERMNNSGTMNLELHAIALGEQMVMVVAPEELFDYYDANGSTLPEDNDWLDLTSQKVLGKDSYGTPFYLGYSNNRTGYIPNTLAYDYYTDVTGKATVNMGSYEANSSFVDKGTGEQVMDKFAEMIYLVTDGYYTAPCEACNNEPKEWTPLTAIDAGKAFRGDGHYYLAEDFNRSKSVSRNVAAGETLCLDLNGHKIDTDGRTFVVNGGGTLNIMDSQNSGTITSYTGNNNVAGGMIYLSGELNLYGGTLRFVKEDHTSEYDKDCARGGVVAILDNGVMHMYGGTIWGGDVVPHDGLGDLAATNNGSGGAIYIVNGGTLEVSGGTIHSGTVQSGHDGPCVYVAGTRSRISLSGAANVEDIAFDVLNTSILTVSGAYTGTTNLSFASGIELYQGMVIGKAANNADISGAISITDTTKPWEAVVDGTDLLLNGYKDTTVAVIGGTEYSSLQEAVDQYNGTIIKMVRNEKNAVTVNEGKDIYLDLNGCSVTGEVTVEGDYTLYCKDSKTDDFTVSDGKYGKLKTVSDNVKGIPEASDMADDGYLKVTEGDDVSFHRVNLDLTHMTLRAVVNGECSPSVYYRSNFMGDEKVEAAIERYGVALSVQEMPNETNIEDNKICQYSWYDGTTFDAGPAGNSGNGTLLKGIMKTTNATLVNRRNANMGIFGRAYIQTEDGYMFGGGVEGLTLKWVTERADEMWNDSATTDAHRESLVTLYETYTSIVSKWDMTNLTTAMDSSQDGALKVLVIGNSHGLDATNLLYEVFEDQGYDEQKLVLGALYYSGCSMEQHAAFMTGSKAVYNYYENDGTNADGSWNIQKSVVADVALKAHQWDIIILQQMNHRAAKDSVYKATEFKTVINYVRERQIGIPKFGWHMVWTNPDQDEYWDPSSSLSHPTKTDTAWKDTNDAWFPGADGTYDQALMYEKMVQCTQTYIEGDKTFLGEDVFDFVIPACTAVEYAQDVLGLSQAQVYRDYTHMNDYGRLIAAYTWYAKIMELEQISAVGIDAIPAVLHHSGSKYPTAESGYEITPDMQEHIVECVNWALEHPYELPAK